MNALLKKELRQMRGVAFWGLAALLLQWWLPVEVLSNRWYVFNFVAVFVWAACPTLAIYFALNILGAEFGGGTMPGLLMLPVSRQVIWRYKVGLGGAFLLIGVCLWSWLNWRAPSANELAPITLADFWFGQIVFFAVILSGALWSVMWLRQVAAAFWITLLVPGLILTVLAYFFKDGEEGRLRLVAEWVLLVYSLAGYWWARRLFLSAQDLSPAGTKIVLPELFKSATIIDGRRRPGPWRALWIKELKLHQSVHVIAAFLLIGHLGVLTVRQFTHYSINSSPSFILHAYGWLWLFLPLLIGCLSISEERKLGTLTGQLCLPISPARQMMLKIAVALGLAMLYGCLIPLTLEWSHIPLWDAEAVPEVFRHTAWVPLFCVTPVLLGGVGILLITALGMFSSSLNQQNLQAMAAGIGALMASTLIIYLTYALSRYQIPGHWQGALPPFIFAPVLLVSLLWLAARNYRHLATSWRLMLRSLACLLVILCLTTVFTSALYHRVWERWSIFQPTHGQARLTQGQVCRLQGWRNGFQIALNDGRTWLGIVRKPHDSGRNEAHAHSEYISNGWYMDAPHWRELVWFGQQLIGLQADGQVMVLTLPLTNTASGTGKYFQDLTGSEFKTLDADTNWQHLILLTNDKLLALKTDGTLWWLDAAAFRHQVPDGFHPCAEATNFAQALVEESYHTTLLQRDGTLWARSVGDNPHIKGAGQTGLIIGGHLSYWTNWRQIGKDIPLNFHSQLLFNLHATYSPYGA